MKTEGTWDGWSREELIESIYDFQDMTEEIESFLQEKICSKEVLDKEPFLQIRNLIGKYMWYGQEERKNENETD